MMLVLHSDQGETDTETEYIFSFIGI
jgi:hypothetical protein